MNNYIKSWEEFLIQKKYSANTIKDYIKNIKLIFKNKNLDSYDDAIAEFMDSKINIVSNTTIDKYLAVLNKFQTWLLNEKILSIPIDLNYLYKSKNRKNSIVDILTNKEINKLFSYCNTIKDGIRHELAFSILLDTGIRISEFDYFNDPSTWQNDDFIKIKGKSKDERIIPISNRMKDLAILYLSTPSIKIKRDKKIWPSSYSGKNKIIKTIAANCEVKKITAHTFRHTFATNWIYSGHNPYLLMEALGHTTLNQLTYYVAKNQKLLLEEWNGFNNGENKHNIEALKLEVKYYKLEAEKWKNKYEDFAIYGGGKNENYNKRV